MMNKAIFKGIYFHIPFCDNICSYCDFNKMYYNEKLANDYLEALNIEYQSYNINTDYVESLYIGGGSPSSLNEKQLKRLFDIINPKQYKNLKEFTIEINPESFNKDKAEILKQYNINRVSIGVQTFNDVLLKLINRQHTKTQVINCISILRENKIDNISIDLMYGLEKQTAKDIINDLEIVKDLAIKHISAYSLIIEENSILYKQNYHKDEDLDYELEMLLHQELLKQGFEHYEVSNYSKNQKYSKHNLLYWSSQPYLGIGLGAGSYDKEKRWYNTKSITNYNKNKYNREIELLDSIEKKISDDIIVQFRIFNGINLDYFMIEYNIDFQKRFKNVIIKHRDKLYIKNNILYFTKQGQEFLNDIILAFIKEIEEWAQMEYKNPELIVDSLRAQGYRITRAREDIIKVLCNVKHYTVEELVTELKKIKDGVNVATVYNNLNFLVAEGIVNEYNFNNKNSVYELNIGLHAHLICIDCNDVINLEIPEFMQVKDRVEKETQFDVIDAKLDMFGHCKKCIDEKALENSK
ncbi:radical SAM family heme chaperone HemW [Mycoplasma sp. P36-A1]|uniref:radical SAM family heme chaperone HemW n=1 Tax=Mycoplasma sp. P36-A1 TaxID=3252900 RepID=UPI003C2F1F0A